MPTTVTTNYDLEKPAVEGDQDTWGEKLNADLDTLDTLLANRVVKAATGRDSTATTQTMALHLRLPTQQLVATGDHADLQDNSAATCKWVENRIATLINMFFPIKSIMLWSGTVASVTDEGLIALGWCPCDGITRSGQAVPNMQDRIVLCAGPQHVAAEIGGAAGPGLGLHTHPFTSVTPFEAGPEAASADLNLPMGVGAASYSTATTAVEPNLPYYASVYLFKYKNWAVP